MRNKIPKATLTVAIVHAPTRTRSLNALLQSGQAISVAGRAARDLLAGTPFSFAKTHWILPLAADDHA